MSISEKILLAEELWDSITTEESRISVPQSHLDELDRRQEMTYSLRFLPEVEKDVIGGYTWYEEKAVDLGEEFLRILYVCPHN